MSEIEEERIEIDEEPRPYVPEGEEDVPFHTILQVWQEVLRPAEQEARAPITPMWANKITTSYREISFAQMPEFQKRLFDKLATLSAILDDVIESDDECLSYTTPEEDVENNSQHYRDLLTKWQVQIMLWEINWDPCDEFAGVEVGAISEVHRMFLGDIGIVAHLDNIKFEYTDEDKAALIDELNALKPASDE